MVASQVMHWLAALRDGVTMSTIQRTRCDSRSVTLPPFDAIGVLAAVLLLYHSVDAAPQRWLWLCFLHYTCCNYNVSYSSLVTTDIHYCLLLVTWIIYYHELPGANKDCSLP